MKESTEPMFFSATPPQKSPEDLSHVEANPEFDRPGVNSLPGFDVGTGMFVTGVSGVIPGAEGAMRLLALSTNALYETDLERRLKAISEALTLMKELEDDAEAADVIEMHKGILLGSMAGALMARRQGNAAMNRVEAIDHYTRAIAHFSAEKDAENIAKTKYNLAHAYMAGLSSDNRSDGLLALSYLREAIRETSDRMLGSASRLNFAALVMRLNQDGETSDGRIEEAIRYASEALTLISKTHQLSMWSSAMNSLGNLYFVREGGDRRANLQSAIKHYEGSLEGRTEKTSRTEWTATTRALNEAKRRLATEFSIEESEPVEADITRRRALITEQEKRGRPVLAAGEKVGLARELIIARQSTEKEWAEAAEILNEAIDTFRERGALAETVAALRLLHVADLRRDEEMLAAYHGWYALALSEQLEEGGVELERVREISQSLAGLDARVAILFLAQGESAAAIDALEYGRARFLRSALRLRAAAPGDRAALDAARAKVISLERQMGQQDQASSDEVAVFMQARLDLAKLEAHAFPAPQSAEGENAMRRTWLVAERLMQSYRAIILPVFDGKRCATVVLSMVGEELRALTAFHEHALDSIVDQWMQTNWDDPAEIKRSIEAVAESLWEVFGAYVAQGLVKREIPFGSRVAIVPSGIFGLLPLSLAGDPKLGVRLCDLFELSFSPSILALEAGSNEPENKSLAAIVNPSEDLLFAPVEALTSRGLFAADRGGAYLLGDACTKPAVLAALNGHSHWLFSAHAEFDRTDARKSGLRLSNEDYLTLDDLLTLGELRPPRLVILSACESGVHAVDKAANEFLGLPVGFLQLGAGAVLGTLWPVNDVSTALFISAFMTSHIGDGVRPAMALMDAQRWVREVNVKNLWGIVERLARDHVPAHTRHALQAFGEFLEQQDPETCLFAHPYYWGGFVLYGT